MLRGTSSKDENRKGGFGGKFMRKSMGFWAMTVERMVMAFAEASPSEPIEEVPGTMSRS